MRHVFDRATASVGMIALLAGYGLSWLARSPWPLAGFVALFVLFLALRLAATFSPRVHGRVRRVLDTMLRVVDAILYVVFLEFLVYRGRTKPAAPPRRTTTVGQD